MDSFDKLRNRATSAIATLESVLVSFQEAVSAQLDQINSNQDRIEQSHREVESANAELKALKEANRAEIKQLEADVKPLRTEKHKLDGEISALVAQKGDLKMDNARLEQSNKDFRKYEAGAWKVLTAKDEELQEREKAVRHKEQLSPTTASLLPPRS